MIKLGSYILMSSAYGFMRSDFAAALFLVDWGNLSYVNIGIFKRF